MNYIRLVDFLEGIAMVILLGLQISSGISGADYIKFESNIYKL